MVAGRVDEATLRAHPDCSPRLLQMAAAQLAVRRKAAAAAAAAARLGAGRAAGVDPGAVKKGPFLGQMVLRLDGGTGQRCGPGGATGVRF
jgi:hypothetical protein